MTPVEPERVLKVLQIVDIDGFPARHDERGDVNAPEAVDRRMSQRRTLPDKTTRSIHRVDMCEERDMLELEFEGDGFLYKMVRLIVGSLLHVARGREPKEWFTSLLTDPTGPQSNQTAPACGLYLVRVSYPAA